MSLTVAGFIIFCALFCVVLSFVIVKVCLRRNTKSGPIPDMESSTPTLNQNVYILDKRREKMPWSLKTTKIIRELGSGYFSKVFLSEDKHCGYVAIKTGRI